MIGLWAGLAIIAIGVIGIVVEVHAIGGVLDRLWR